MDKKYIGKKLLVKDERVEIEAMVCYAKRGSGCFETSNENVGEGYILLSNEGPMGATVYDTKGYARSYRFDTIRSVNYEVVKVIKNDFKFIS